MSTTKIQWATHVLNAFTGCDRCSAGCASCYAVPTAAANQRKELGRARKARELGKPEPRRRYMNDGDPRTSGPGFGFTVHWDKLERPERFPSGARVFVNSMSDVFHEDAPLEAIAALWRVFASRPDVNWLVLTKRAERMHEVLGGWRTAARAGDADALPVAPELDDPAAACWRQWVDGLANVWLGVTVENGSWVHRAELLRGSPAAVRFVSAEPLLGPLVGNELTDAACERAEARLPIDSPLTMPRLGESCAEWWARLRRELAPNLDLAGIDWLIAGGESGGREGRRLVDGLNQPREDRIGWVRALRDACAASTTAFFFKQWGGPRSTSGGRELDGRTWDELPGAAR